MAPSFPRRLLGSCPLRWVGIGVSWIPLVIFFNSNVAQLMWVSGPSMQPFLSPNYTSAGRKDTVLSVMHKPWDNLQRGMVVAFWSPIDPEKMLIKRVIALEGDTVFTRPPYPFKTEAVPPGHVWVEGDDGFHSIDSNTYGPVSRSLLTGRVTHVVWPANRAGRIRWEDFKAPRRVIHGSRDMLSLP